MSIYNQQVTVRVWRNVKTLGKVPTSHFGHAAVTISGNMVPNFKQHISFWPGGFASKGLNAIQAKPGSWTSTSGDDKASEMNKLTALRLEVGYCRQHGIPYPKAYDEMLAGLKKTPIAEPRPGQKRLDDVDDDGLPMWSQSPEWKVDMPGLGVRERHWGLSVRRMGLWWKSFQATNPNYQALGVQNCAGVALMGLKEGGSEAFVKCPGIKVYGEPVQVEMYASQLATQLERMEDWTRQLDADIKQGVLSGVVQATPSDSLSDGLWKPETWKKHSALGTFKVRSAAIRDIDKALEAYHAFDWKAQFAERYAALVTLFLAIVKHRQDKAESARSDAVLRLGAQILGIMRNPGPIW